MITQLRQALSLFLMLTVLTGVLYPLAVTGLGRALFPASAGGSLIVDARGRVVGSRLIGQAFTEPGHFWSRPSATAPQPYNAASSGGSNLSPTNPALVEARTQRAAALRAADPDNSTPIPPDLLAASGSGLDPHVSPEAAQWQAARVARARGLPIERVRALVDAHTEDRTFGLLGEPRVNVLELNLALDALAR